MYVEEDFLQLSGIQHFAYCPRQWALIHLEQQWQENLQTAEGRIMHERVHDASIQDSRGGIVTLRGVVLISYLLGLRGIADVVEFIPVDDETINGMHLLGYKGQYLPRPVEYKRGKPKKDDRDKVQLCAQAMCLEEMYGLNITDGSLYYGQTRHRIDVVFSDVLRERVITLANQIHEVFTQGITPPAQSLAGCKQCSLVDVCLPNMSRKAKSARAYLSEQIDSLIE